MSKKISTEFNESKRRDLYAIDPRNIVVIEGFNSRVDFDLEELKASIVQSGVKNPVSVIPFIDENGFEKYRLVDGERRYRAAMELINEGFEIARIPAIYLPKNTSEADLLVEQCIRNEGKKFSEYEYGVLLQKFQNLGWTTTEAVAKLGLAPWKAIYITHVNRDLRVQELLKNGQISGSNVRAIYQAHKDDVDANGNSMQEANAVKEILALAKKAEATSTPNEKKKLSLSDLDADSKTILVKDSAAIKKGITLLLKYYEQATVDGSSLDLDITDVLESLKKGKTIDVIFNEAKSNNYAEAE